MTIQEYLLILGYGKLDNDSLVRIIEALGRDGKADPGLAETASQLLGYRTRQYDWALDLLAQVKNLPDGELMHRAMYAQYVLHQNQQAISKALRCDKRTLEKLIGDATAFLNEKLVEH